MKTRQQREAVVAQVMRLGLGATRAEHVRQVARLHQITERTLYRWISQVRDGAEPKSAEPRRFAVDTEMLTVLADKQTRRGAYEALQAAGIIDVGYSTFCRALHNADPAVVGGALGGKNAFQANGMYLMNFPPHRAYRYHVDHTKMDVWVLSDHRQRRPVRPHLTVITDAFSGYVWAFPWYRKPDSEMVAAALAAVCMEQKVRGLSVGGRPQQVVCDNAAEHFAEAVRTACTHLGIIVAPTTAYESYQNGTAERAVALVNANVCRTAPATTRVEGDASSTRFLASTRSKTPVENFWVAGAFEMALQQTVTRINQGLRRSQRGGLTRLELFTGDPTHRDFLSPEEAPYVAMSARDKPYRATKSGIQFNNRFYICNEMAKGRKYKVRHFPGRRDFIEIFDADDNHVGRAYDQETMTKAQRDVFLAKRARSQKAFKAIEEGVRQHRIHKAALDNEAVADLTVDWGLTIDVPGRDAAQPALPKRPKRPELDIVRADAPDLDATDSLRERAEQFKATATGRESLDFIASLNAANRTSQHSEGGDEQ